MVGELLLARATIGDKIVDKLTLFNFLLIQFFLICPGYVIKPFRPLIPEKMWFRDSMNF